MEVRDIVSLNAYRAHYRGRWQHSTRIRVSLVGETCQNNENLNGTVFGQFRCPLNGFPYEAKACCGEYGKQFCCIPERTRSDHDQLVCGDFHR